MQFYPTIFETAKQKSTVGAVLNRVEPKALGLTSAASLRLYPVALAELGWMAMTVVDTFHDRTARSGRDRSHRDRQQRFLFVCIFGMGLLLGLDTLVSQAFGAEIAEIATIRFPKPCIWRSSSPRR